MLTIDRHGRMTFEQWADQDLQQATAPPCHRDLSTALVAIAA